MLLVRPLLRRHLVLAAGLGDAGVEESREIELSWIGLDRWGDTVGKGERDEGSCVSCVVCMRLQYDANAPTFAP
jgi:hypothetical protein